VQAGTPEALIPIADQVLAWVAGMKDLARAAHVPDDMVMDDLRRIELCALATREAAMLHSLYPPPG
jgi:hypothetical protein